MSAPAVTVIIPTYNWSAALRCSVASVLAQTRRDFELLVVGDACTDDSEEVIRAFADRRVQWHNLPSRGRSQSGPNNHGVSLARGEFIAYLGHDDLWHPDHLRTLLDRQFATGADLVCAMALLFGPPESGIRAVTGALVDGEDHPDNFYPPSSILHRRSLIERAGPWRAPEDLPSPVDCELLARMRRHGARITGTGRLTAFKFNAAWRRDSYRRRDTGEQERLLARLRADPSAVIAEELEGVARAAREKRLIDVRMPDSAEAAPGAYYRHNLRSRGLDDAESVPLVERRRFRLDDQVSALDWHAVESSPAWGSFRWTGPSPASLIVLPVRAPEHTRITLQVLNWYGADLGDELTLRVNGRPVVFTCEGDSRPAVRLCGVVSRDRGEGDGPMRIHLETRVMRCPHFLHGSADERWLGVCVNWVDVEPADRGGPAGI